MEHRILCCIMHIINWEIFTLLRANYDLAFDCHQTALDLSLKKQNPVNFLTASSYQNLGLLLI